MIQSHKADKKDEGKNQLSAEEMKTKLQDHFLKSGALGSLKTQLRSHLVTELFKAADHSKAPAKNDIPDMETEKSLLPLQVSNWLVYEHLRRQEYAYTLSTFVSEAKISAPETLLSIQDILELIGLRKKSTEYEKLMKGYYTKTEKDSLLHSILSSAIKCYVSCQSSPQKPFNEDDNSQEAKDHDSSPLHKLQIDKSTLVENVYQQNSEITEDKKLYFNYNGTVQTVSSAEQLQKLYQDILNDKKRQESEIMGIRQKLLNEFDNIYQHEQEVRLELERRRKRFIQDQDRFNVEKSKLKAKELELEKRYQLMEEELAERIKIKTESIAPFLQMKEEELRKQEAELKKQREWLDQNKSLYNSRGIELDELRSRLEQIECSHKILQNKYSFALSEKTELCNKLESLSDYEVIKVELSHKLEELGTSQKKVESIKAEAKSENKKLLKTIQDLKERNAEISLKMCPPDVKSVGISTEPLKLQEPVVDQQKERLEQELRDAKESYQDILHRMEEQKQDIQELHRTLHIWHHQLSQNRNEVRSEAGTPRHDVGLNPPSPNRRNHRPESSTNFERTTENHQSLPKASNSFLYHPAVQLRHYSRDEPVKFIAEAKKRINSLQEEAYSLEQKYSELVASHPRTLLPDYSSYDAYSSNFMKFPPRIMYEKLGLPSQSFKAYSESYNMPSFVPRHAKNSEVYEAVSASNAHPNLPLNVGFGSPDVANFKHYDEGIPKEDFVGTTKEMFFSLGENPKARENFESNSYVEKYDSNLTFPGASHTSKPNLPGNKMLKTAYQPPSSIAKFISSSELLSHSHNDSPCLSKQNNGAFKGNYGNMHDSNFSHVLISNQAEEQFMIPLERTQSYNEKLKSRTLPTSNKAFASANIINQGNQASNTNVDHSFHVKTLGMLGAQESVDDATLAPDLEVITHSCSPPQTYASKMFAKTGNNFKNPVCLSTERTGLEQLLTAKHKKLEFESTVQLSTNFEIKSSDTAHDSSELNEEMSSKMQSGVKVNSYFEENKIEPMRAGDKASEKSSHQQIESSNPLNASVSSLKLANFSNIKEPHKTTGRQILSQDPEKNILSYAESALPTSGMSTPAKKECSKGNKVDQANDSAVIETRRISVDLDAAWKNVSEPISKMFSRRHSVQSSNQSLPKKDNPANVPNFSHEKADHDVSTCGKVKMSGILITEQSGPDNKVLKHEQFSHNQTKTNSDNHTLSRGDSTDTMERIPVIDSDSFSQKEQNNESSICNKEACGVNSPIHQLESVVTAHGKGSSVNMSDISVPLKERSLSKADVVSAPTASKNELLSLIAGNQQGTNMEADLSATKSNKDISGHTTNNSEKATISVSAKSSDTTLKDSVEKVQLNSVDLHQTTSSGIKLHTKSSPVNKDDPSENSVSELSELNISVGSVQLAEEEKGDDSEW